ncbi:MAG TPA: ImmA/IrrE family metallo-endopeptidase [Kofleriaceae bacterium]|jgi:Zn-dependent peptidase ImmA (M78 family)|nr:ImmA/IrrE family metallo-endopeptidase [Kofleriaceae bacterium]
MKELGDRTSFALAFQLRDDPDPASPAEVRASWGSIQIWISGLNITTGVTAAGQAVDSAECPLLPIASWFLNHWDPLFHEERLPQKDSASSSAEWHTTVLYSEVDESKFETLIDQRLAWWSRHGLGAALPDFRIPDVHFRRRDADVEISWSDAEWRDLRSGVQLSVQPGVASVPIATVCDVVEAWCLAVVDELRDRVDVRALTRTLAELRAEDRTLPRLQLAAGLNGLETAARGIRRMAGLLDGDVTQTVKQLLGVSSHTKQGTNRLYATLTIPVLLYRSAQPNLSEADLQCLMRLADDMEQGSAPGFDAVHNPTRCPLSAEAATQSGYELARTLRRMRDLPLTEPLTSGYDLENVVLRALAIDVQEVTLVDRGVEGVAIWRPHHLPRIAINSTGRFSSTPWGRRMTLVHELCHLISDGTTEIGVGMVSNSWAPALLERRANAFAAMFLAPPAAIEKVLNPEPEQWKRPDLVNAMRRLGIGATTLCRHLQNLGWISREDSIAWIEQLVNRDE